VRQNPGSLRGMCGWTQSPKLILLGSVSSPSYAAWPLAARRDLRQRHLQAKADAFASLLPGVAVWAVLGAGRRRQLEVVMKFAAVLLPTLVAAFALLSTASMGRSTAAAVRPTLKPATDPVPQAWCTCPATPVTYFSCVSGCVASFTDIVTTPGVCTPSCHNDIPCIMTASVTFSGSCTGGPFPLSTKPECGTQGANSHRCPGDTVHSAGIVVECGVCQWN
jgi:hypothetical protein